RVLHPQVRAERAHLAAVELPLQALGLLPGDVQQGEPVADRRIAIAQLLEVLGRGTPSAPDVRVVALDVVGTAGGPVRHHEHADRRTAHRAVRSCTRSTRRWRFSTGVWGSTPCPRVKTWPPRIAARSRISAAAE